jgi:hypothetical protein
MSEVTKVVMPVAIGTPNNASGVTKIVMYVAFSTTPVTPPTRRSKARVYSRYYTEPGL